jgi:CHAT domain-containing protein
MQVLHPCSSRGRRPSAARLLARLSAPLLALAALTAPLALHAQAAPGASQPDVQAGSLALQAMARKKDAETLVNLSAEGKALYERDTIKLSGYAYCGQALALADRGDLRQSIRAASKALHLGQRDGDAGMKAVALRDLAIAYSYAGTLDLAEQYAKAALAIPGTDAHQVTAPSLKVLADVHARHGRFEQALTLYQQSLAVASKRYAPLVRISLANALTAAHRAPEALAQLEQVDAAARQQSLGFFLRSRGNAHLEAGSLDRAAADFSAVASDTRRADADYQRLWASEGLGRVKLAAKDPAGALAAYRDAVDQANALRSRFHSEEFKTGLFGDLQRVFDTALALSVEQQDYPLAWQISEAARARQLLDTLRGRTDDTLSRQHTLADVQARLGDGDALLQYHAVGEAMVVWLIRRNSVQGRRISVSEAALASQVDRFRDSIVHRRADTQAQAHALHTLLIPPQAAQAGPLFIVPHGPLHYLPFQALHDGRDWFIQSHAITVWPSASVGVELLQRPQRARASLLAFGNPATDKNVPLPGAEREVQKLATLFRDNSVFVQREATKARFKQSADSAAVLHVAAHAEVDEVDPLFSRILFSSSSGDTGLLEAREIFELKLAGVKLVTLSACESGLGKVNRGEEIVGFTRSFLSAGADSIIASLWPVADESTEALMSTLYQELMSGRDLGTALQTAQRQLQANRRFAHPFFWAPFYVIGNGRLQVAS